MSDLEQTAMERLRFAAEMSLRVYKQPLVITYSGGKDSDVLLHLAGEAGIHSMPAAGNKWGVSAARWLESTDMRSLSVTRKSKLRMSGRLTG